MIHKPDIQHVRYQAGETEEYILHYYNFHLQIFRLLLPDAQLPFPQGKEVLQNNWDFITRYFLDEYYEGE